jgi:hypothetical protein
MYTIIIAIYLILSFAPPATSDTYPKHRYLPSLIVVVCLSIPSLFSFKPIQSIVHLGAGPSYDDKGLGGSGNDDSDRYVEGGNAGSNNDVYAESYNDFDDYGDPDGGFDGDPGSDPDGCADFDSHVDFNTFVD